MSDLKAGQILQEQIALVRPLGSDGEARVWLLRDGATGATLVGWFLPRGASLEPAERLRDASLAAGRRAGAQLPSFLLHRTAHHRFLALSIREGCDLGRLRALVERVLSPPSADPPEDGTALENELASVLGDIGAPPTSVPPETRSAGVVIPPPRVRPIEPVVTRTASGGRAGAPAGSDRRSSGRAFLLLALLGLLAAGSFFLLPRWAQSRRTKASATTAPAPAPDASRTEPDTSSLTPQELSERIYVKQRAQESRGRAVRLLQALEQRGVTVWAHDDHAEALERMAQGRRQWDAGQFLESDASFRKAAEFLAAIDARSADILRETLARGREALAAGRAIPAAAAFNLALRIAPGNKTAATGLRRAEAFDRVRARIDSGLRSERKGNLREAVTRYREAIALDPLSREARESLARVQKRIDDDAFARSMSRGLETLDRGDYQEATEAFQAAGAIRPDSPQVAEALEQVEENRKLEMIHHYHDRAVKLEEEEQWAEAARQYQAVLAIDDTIRFARDGRSRSLRRAELAKALEFQLAHPDRLSADAVLEEARTLLEEARAARPAGPVLQRQIARLDELVRTNSTPIRVTLESDNLTEVTVYHVGRLGRFLRHELDLRPGTYTVVGSRKGYRDVRRQLKVVAGTDPEPLIVRCEDKI
ncbi:MAG: hypothetical protein ACE5HU_06060 [Acidobacteriota bacterium]